MPALGLAGLLAIAIAAFEPSPMPVQPAPFDWKAAARGDVLAAYALYVANHPGMHDPGNPGFARQLEKARDAGLAIAETAQSEADHGNALGAFSAVLSDGHARALAIQPDAAQKRRQTWPGFIAAWRGRMLVHEAGPESPAPKGSQILSCDGKPAVDFVRGQLAYRGFRPTEAGHWWVLSTQAFIATEGVGSGPKRCEFLLPDGSRNEAELTYREVPANFGDMLSAATDGERTPIGLVEARPGMFLVGMPDFNPGEAGVAAYRALFNALKARRAELLGAKAVVIDLRHNNGGSSEWSRQGARLLWGEGPVDARMDAYFRDARVWWRASPDNAAYVTNLEEKIRKDGNGEVADLIREIAGGMREAAAKGEHYYVEKEEKRPETEAGVGASTGFTTPVYVITPGRCASACLDAIDTFVQFDNVKLIGAPTSGDSTYMDVRVAALPSGRGRLVIPNKMWVGRPRGNGEVYGPHILFTDLDWSTGSFLDAIARDLAKR